MQKSEIIQKIREGQYNSQLGYPKQRKYPENHIFDEEESVKWNKEEVARKNRERADQMDEYRLSQIEGMENFRNDLVAYLIFDYYFKGVEDRVHKIYERAYRDYHSEGLEAVLEGADELAEFVEDFIYLTRGNI